MGSRLKLVEAVHKNGSEAQRKLGRAQAKTEIVTNNTRPVREKVVNGQMLSLAMDKIEPSALRASNIHLIKKG